jgi:Co/Zn/Cd efflux system component
VSARGARRPLRRIRRLETAFPSISAWLAITVAQVAGDLRSGGLARLSDAAHSFSDAASLGISYAARRMSHRCAGNAGAH